ncbi:MAG: glycosyltransferase family 4 protein [Candidatus Obscuribacterales bacterium]|jgi:glycosyltransferase involved in cell wall biosynthesis|nr:glycosyltransferase family 4 protein [Candidatus Obscuribacterales bacterium]
MSFNHIAMVMRQFSAQGGLELYAYKLVEGLLAKGLRISVICQQNDSTLAAENLKVISIGKQACSRNKWQRMQAEYNSISQGLAQAGDFDLIHSQHYPVAQADLVTFHNHSTKQLSRKGFPWEKLLNESKRSFAKAYKLRDEFDDLLCRNASCLLFPSAVMQKDFYMTYPSLLAEPQKPYVISAPGADLAEQSDINTQSELGTNLLFVGRGFRKKGLDVLLAACQNLSAQKRSFKLFIAGIRKKPIDDLRLAFMGLQDHVQYLGFQKDMNSVYEKASIIVLPSRVEPFGMAPIQAMRHGLVPVVSNTSGVAEVLQDQVDSLILQDHLSATELSSLLGKLMDDKNLLQSLAQQATKTAATINWDNTVNSTLQAYAIAWKIKRSGQ